MNMNNNKLEKKNFDISGVQGRGDWKIAVFLEYLKSQQPRKRDVG